MVSILHDRLQNAILTVVNDNLVPQVEMAVRSNQYKSPTNPENSVIIIEPADLLKNYPKTPHLRIWLVRAETILAK